jgi:hypothetical protein
MVTTTGARRIIGRPYRVPAGWTTDVLPGPASLDDLVGEVHQVRQVTIRLLPTISARAASCDDR